MEIISKVSKGSRMDQIYIPKTRGSLSIGTHVVIKPLDIKKPTKKPYFYNLKHIEPIKTELTEKIFNIIDSLTDNENIIITGSFLDGGFNFNDIDIIIVSKGRLNKKYIGESIENKIKIKIHIVLLDNKTLTRGLATDPLYQVMLSKCIAKKRFVYKTKTKHKINYKILDLHLLKSKFLIDNFDHLNGNEKYYLIRNMVAISLYLKHKKLNKEKVDREIKKIFKLKSIEEIKQNLLDKNMFLRKYKKVYKATFNKIMRNIKADGTS